MLICPLRRRRNHVMRSSAPCARASTVRSQRPRSGSLATLLLRWPTAHLACTRERVAVATTSHCLICSISISKHQRCPAHVVVVVVATVATVAAAVAAVAAAAAVGTALAAAPAAATVVAAAPAVSRVDLIVQATLQVPCDRTTTIAASGVIRRRRLPSALRSCGMRRSRAAVLRLIVDEYSIAWELHFQVVPCEVLSRLPVQVVGLKDT